MNDKWLLLGWPMQQRRPRKSKAEMVRTHQFQSPTCSWVSPPVQRLLLRRPQQVAHNGCGLHQAGNRQVQAVGQRMTMGNGKLLVSKRGTLIREGLLPPRGVRLADGDL